MAPVTNLYRLAFGGSLFGTESWSCSLHVASDSIATHVSEDFAVPIGLWHVSDVRNSSASKLEFVKFNQISKTTGKQVLEGTTDVFFYPSPTTGTSAPAPAQTTIAMSLTTALVRGRAHSGRIYPPSGAAYVATDSNGLVPSAQVESAIETTRTLLSSLNGILGPSARLIVWSQVGQKGEDILGVRAGHVLDTQRRRRRQLVEDYTVVHALS